MIYCTINKTNYNKSNLSTPVKEKGYNQTTNKWKAR